LSDEVSGPLFSILTEDLNPRTSRNVEFQIRNPTYMNRVLIG